MTQKSCNRSGQKKITHPHGTKQITQPLGTKKIMQPLGTKKNHATSLKFLSGHFEFVTVYLGLVVYSVLYFSSPVAISLFYSTILCRNWGEVFVFQLRGVSRTELIISGGDGG